MEPTTQGQEEVSQEQSPEAPQTIPVERFNEVYKESQENKRVLAEMQAALAQSQATIAGLQARPVAPTEEAPEMDPEDQKKLDYHLNRQMGPVMAELKALRAQVGSVGVAPQITQVESQLAKINNPAVTARTRELIKGLQANGKLGAVYTPAECMKQALGEFALGEVLRGDENQHERDQYNGSGVAPLGGGSTGGGRRQQGGAQKPGPAVPANRPLEDMSVDDLSAFIQAQEKLNPDGFKF